MKIETIYFVLDISNLAYENFLKIWKYTQLYDD